MNDQDDQIDQRQWLKPGEPIMTLERAAMPDVQYERECDGCKGTGKSDGKRCRECRGRGRVLDASIDRALLTEGELKQIRFAQVQVCSVMNHLWSRRIISDQNLHDGQTYERWCLIFRAPLDYAPNPIYRSEFERSIRAEGLNVDDYVKIIRRLANHEKRVLELAIFTPELSFGEKIISRNGEAYQKAFARLTTLMEPLREAARSAEEEKNGCTK